MQSSVIQRHYDEVIAPHYDRDPQGVLGESLDRALAQVAGATGTAPALPPLRVLDVGMGTGRFLERLRNQLGRRVEPHGLDLSANMVAVARRRLPDLEAAVADAAHLDRQFTPSSFDLVCTHFVSGFVPLGVLAPQIRRKLAPGGYWSFVGGTLAGFPVLRRKAESRLLRRLFGGATVDVDGRVTNPADGAEVRRVLEAHGFAIRDAETYRPELHFTNFDEFMEFAYYGGWLTPFVEGLGLHRAGRLLRSVLNAVALPACDHHCIEIVLARKVG